MPIVAAAVVSHQPGIMLPDKVRERIPGGDFSLVEGFKTMRQKLKDADVNTLVIFDTHWFTTSGHVVAGASSFNGIYTSEELPDLIKDHKYNWNGCADLATKLAEKAKREKVPLLNVTTPSLPVHYPTVNVLHYLLQDGLEDLKVLSISCCQAARDHNFIQLGCILKEAIDSIPDLRVAYLGSGGMSHEFPALDDFKKHQSKDASNVLTPDARKADENILELWKQGNHEQVIEGMSTYHKFSPEGFFGHYLCMYGALGGGKNITNRGYLLSDYENAAGTGQVHVWFDVDSSNSSSSSSSMPPLSKL